jgi:hypothetical protein
LYVAFDIFAQNVKIVESALHLDSANIGILQMRSVSHSPSAVKLGESPGINTGHGHRIRTHSRDDEELDSDDDMTIMVRLDLLSI